MKLYRVKSVVDSARRQQEQTQHRDRDMAVSYTHLQAFLRPLIQNCQEFLVAVLGSAVMYIAFVIQIEIFDGHIKSGGYWVICIKLCLVEFAECKRNLHAVFFKCTKYIGIIIQGNRRFQIILVKPVLSYDCLLYTSRCV